MEKHVFMSIMIKQSGVQQHVKLLESNNKMKTVTLLLLTITEHSRIQNHKKSNATV